MKQKVQTLRGFNDWFAPDVRLRKFVINTFEKVFEKYGYEPLETPALEYTKFMLNISGSEAEKQFYRFSDPGGRDVMLKYEVMISMCRAVASNINDITFPYKRYQIQPVWRSENTQKGRYRQFTQCDADTIGSTSLVTDGEFIQMGLEIIKNLGFKKYIARISNRKFLNGLGQYLDIPQDKFYGMCMSIDKLAKTNINSVEKELITKRGLNSQQAKKIVGLIDTNQYNQLSNIQIVDKLMDTIGKTSIGLEALNELRQIFNYLKINQVPEKLYRFDTSIARGLASYTGPVWEFEIVDGDVGSIAGCGRYDNVIGQYLDQKKQIPATGGSFGIERICDIIKDRAMFESEISPAKAMISNFDPSTLERSIKTANLLRSNNISTLLYPTPDKLSKQFKYASVKKIPFVIILGPDEIKDNTVTIKNMITSKQQTIPQSNLLAQFS